MIVQIRYWNNISKEYVSRIEMEKSESSWHLFIISGFFIGFFQTNPGVELLGSDLAPDDMVMKGKNLGSTQGCSFRGHHCATT